MYKPGQYLQICDVCGFKFLSGDTRKRWDGLIVCSKDYETDHPQKYLRVSADKISVDDPRPPSDDTFRYVCYFYATHAYAGIAEAGCAKAGYTLLPYSEVVSLKGPL